LTDELQKGDLIFLVADKDIEYTIRGLMNRSDDLGIRDDLRHHINVHSKHDSGCFSDGHQFLRLFLDMYKHAILILDYEGCGREHLLGRTEIEDQLEENLSANGWGDRAAAIVIEPELETWVWVASTEVGRILGWRRDIETLDDWMIDKGHKTTMDEKPNQPKEVMQEVLRITRKKRSSSLYMQLAEQVDFSGCVDPAFIKLRDILKLWFSR
jgi:hypothetical protein